MASLKRVAVQRVAAADRIADELIARSLDGTRTNAMPGCGHSLKCFADRSPQRMAQRTVRDVPTSEPVSILTTNPEYWASECVWQSVYRDAVPASWPTRQPSHVSAAGWSWSSRVSPVQFAAVWHRLGIGRKGGAPGEPGEPGATIELTGSTKCTGLIWSTCRCGGRRPDIPHA